MMTREGTLEDGLLILADLREQQCKTLEKLQVDPEVLLRQALSAPATTLVIDGHPAAMFGVKKETLLGLAKIWLITTPLIEKERVAFLRYTRRTVKELHALHGALIGVVDCDFPKSLAWMQWCGFTEFRRGPEFIIMRYAGGH